MNCDCIRNLKKRLKEENPQRFKKEIEVVECSQEAIICDSDISTLTFCEFEFTLKDQKKKVKTNVFHSFCPYCGISCYSKEENDK